MLMMEVKVEFVALVEKDAFAPGDAVKIEGVGVVTEYVSFPVPKAKIRVDPDMAKIRKAKG